MNEMLLAQHLFSKTNDPKMKRWVINQLMGTYYHNFVTHLLEGNISGESMSSPNRGTHLPLPYCLSKLAPCSPNSGAAELRLMKEQA